MRFLVSPVMHNCTTLVFKSFHSYVEYYLTYLDNVFLMLLLLGTLFLVTLSVAGFGAVASYFPQVLDAKQAILQYISGKFFLANNCQVEFDWSDPCPVGQTVSLRIRVSFFL